MALTDVATKYRYEGNGVTDAFSFPAKPFSASSLVVQIITRATDAAVETLELTTHYTVTIAVDGESATVTITDSAKIPSSLQDILIVRTLASSQESEFPKGTTFDTAAVELALDKLTALHQQQKEILERSITAPLSESGSANLEIPALGNRLNKYLSFDGDGNLTTADGTGTETPVSSAMAPVVSASSLADARTELGLGSVAVLSSISGGNLTEAGTTSAQLRTALTDETGTGAAVFGTSPTLTAPNIVGTVTNDNAAAGSIGEYIESVIPSGSAVSLVSGTAKNVTSISLTAGDWDVSGIVAFIGGATTVTTYTSCCINNVSNTMRSLGLIGSVAEDADVTDISRSMSTGPVRFSLASTTTVYLVARATFTTSTLTAFGGITARRVR